MNYTKQELEEAILEMGNYVGRRKAYEMLLKTYISLPEFLRIVVLDMFNKKFDYRSCEMGLYRAYSIIFEYSKELSQEGFVEFKKQI